MRQQSIVTLDVEGVLVPEIWIAVSERTGIPELRRTTRDEPDYDKLMKYRLGLLDQHGLKMSMIADVIAGMGPMEGAREFLDDLRSRTQVILLSDTFEQFGRPLMEQLGWPTIFCHQLIVGLNFRVAAAGDSYNDTAMLAAADAGFLFHAPENVIREFPQFPALNTYEELSAHLLAAIA